MINFESLIGKTIASVGLTDDRSKFRIVFDEGTLRCYAVEGDCCSHSWIEHLETPDDLAGAVLLLVVNTDVVTSDHTAHDKENGGDGNGISVYNTRFRTNRGDIVLEFRNSSPNIYYGGNLLEVDCTKADLVWRNRELNPFRNFKEVEK